VIVIENAAGYCSGWRLKRQENNEESSQRPNHFVHCKDSRESLVGKSNMRPMKATRIGAVLLISIAMQGQQTPPASSISVTTPGQTPVYRINLRVHNGHSTLPVADLRSSLEELNFIWWSQAGVCFEIMSSKGDTTAADGFDIWFVPA